MAVKCPFCGKEMIKVCRQPTQPVVGTRTLSLTTRHCPGCGFVAKFASAKEEPPRELEVAPEEKLKQLGYL